MDKISIKLLTVTIMLPLTMTAQDTLSVKPQKKKPLLENRIDYQGEDSIAFDFDSKKVFIYNQGKVNFGSNSLDAGQITLNLDSNTLHAQYLTDTSNNQTQYPVFRDAGKDYQSKELDYNFDTKRGLIKGVFTKEGEGFLHGQKIKKINETTMVHKSGYVHNLRK